MVLDIPLSITRIVAKSSRLISLLLPLSLLSACSSSSVDSTAASAITPPPVPTPTSLIWGRRGEAESLDPHRSAAVFSWQVFDQIYDTLLAFDETGNLVSNLATDWTVSDDGRTITFTLDQNIQCHDGTPFDAEDVKFTADRALDNASPSLTKASWGPIERVEVVDPLTVNFEFSQPFAAFLPFMADPFASMICDSNSELASDTFGSTQAIGTGPWKLMSWAPGEDMVLERNPDYVNRGRPVDNSGAPHVEQLIIRPIPESYARLSDLRDDTVQIISEPPIEDIDTIQQDGQLETVIARKTGQSVFLQFTTARPPFNDLRARQAIAHAIDPDAAIASALGDWVTPEKCPLASGVLGHDPELCDRVNYDYNPAQAKKLLAELGYGPEKPLEVTLITWMGDNREKMVEIFQAQLAEVGIKADIETMDISTMNSRVTLENQRRSGKGMFNLIGWAWYDPDLLHALWHSPGAYGGYHSDELDALLDKTRTTIDPNARLKAVQDVQTYLLENAIMVPIYTPGWLWIYATRAEVDGFKVGPFNRPVFNDVRLAPQPIDPSDPI